MFGRLGRLNNIDNYYLFQPLELKNSRVSLYENTHSIKYKRKVLNITIPPLIEQKTTFTMSNMDKIQQLYKNNIEIDKTTFGNIIDIVVKLTDIKKEDLENVVLNSVIDRLQFYRKKQLIEYIMNKTELNGFENKVKQYIEKSMMIKHNRKKYFILISNTKKVKDPNVSKLIYYFDDKELKTINKLIFNDIKSEIINYIKTIKENINDIIGFINFNNSGNLIFKVKNITGKKSSSGKTCKTTSKTQLEEGFFNKIKLPDTLMNIINKTRDGKDTTIKLNREQLCVLLELILRYYNYSKKDDKRWFYNNEQLIIGGINYI